MTDTTDLDRLRALAFDASPGRRVLSDLVTESIRFGDSDKYLVRAHDEDCYWWNTADRDFVIACDRETILSLFERLEAAEVLVQKMRGAARSYFEHFGADHDADCPEDDTCSCPLVVAINEAFHD
jgi:hypothetical protein